MEVVKDAACRGSLQRHVFGSNIPSSPSDCMQPCTTPDHFWLNHNDVHHLFPTCAMRRCRTCCELNSYFWTRMQLGLISQFHMSNTPCYPSICKDLIRLKPFTQCKQLNTKALFCSHVTCHHSYMYDKIEKMHSLVKRQAMKIQQPRVNMREAVTKEFG